MSIPERTPFDTLETLSSAVQKRGRENKGPQDFPENPSPKRAKMVLTKFLDDFWGPLSLLAPLFYC